MIRSSMRGHPGRFRSVRDVGRVATRCPCESGEPRGCSFLWLPAWLPSWSFSVGSPNGHTAAAGLFVPKPSRGVDCQRRVLPGLGTIVCQCPSTCTAGWAIVTHLVTRSLGESAAALMVCRDDQTDDHDDRSGRKYQDHREDVLEDPVLACYPLPVLQRHLGPGRMIAGGRIVQVESSAAPAPAVRWLSLSRATKPNHHASAALPPLCGQCSAVQDARKDRCRRALVELSSRT